MRGRPFRLARVSVVAAAVAAFVVPALAVPAVAAAGGSERLVVHTRSGPVRGEVVGEASQFLAVPYAAAPVGNLRFRAPQPVPSWRGVRDATEPGAACVQFAAFGIEPTARRSEDCLNLDVYRPGQARPGARLPVIVWIHGGGFVQGTGTEFSGRATAELTGAIVVSINYRLGALGYLALPGLDAESREGSGNWAVLDQIAALRWVQDNAVAFGGDPRKVTVSGQSAGSISVCALLASPSASGLFSRAVLQSGPCNLLTAPPLADAQARGAEYAARVGCTDAASALACLRAATPEALVAAGIGSGAGELSPATPVSGTRTLPVSPNEAITSGRWNKVPLVIGSTRDEGKLFALNQAGMTPEQYVAAVRAQFGPVAEQVLTRYPLAAYATPFHAWSALVTDPSWACGTAASAAVMARQVPTYQYEFDDPQSPPLRGLDLPGLDTGNAHSAELAYLYEYVQQGRPFTPEQEALATRMKRAWAAFAWTGTPNAWGLTYWPQVGEAERVLKFQPRQDTVFTGFAEEHQCGFWESLGA